MYGTVARLRFKPESAQEALATLKESEDAANPEGAAAVYIYRMDSDPNEFFLVVLFEDKDAYFDNADDPQTNEDYQRWAQFLAAEPEWHDGEVVFVREFK